MARLHGKQIKDNSLTLNKLTGTGIVSFTGSEMTFDAVSILKRTTPFQWEGDDIVNKDYVDAVAQALDIKESVRIKTISNITLSGIQTIQGISLIEDDRILLNGQTNGSENGIWLVKSGAWVRPLDFVDGKVTSGAFTFIEEGTYSDSGFVLITEDPITIGTTNLEFVQFSGAGQIDAGIGLSKNGNELRITDTTVISGTYGLTDNVPQFTVNAQGQITNVSNVPISISSSSITDLSVGVQNVIFQTSNFINSDSISFNVTSGDSVGASLNVADALEIGINGVGVKYDNTTIILDTNGDLSVNIPSLNLIDEVIAGLGLNGGGSTTNGSVTMNVNTGLGLDILNDAIIISNTGVVDGTYGSVSETVTFSVNAQGQITTANSNAIQINQSQVNNLVSDLQIINNNMITNIIGSNGITALQTNNDVDLAVDVATDSGLSFNTSGQLLIDIDSNSLQIIGGQLTVLGGQSEPIYDLDSADSTYIGTNGAGAVTNVSLSRTPNDYSHVIVYVNGQKQLLGDGVTDSDCWFGTSTNSINLMNLNLGDVLVWNSASAGFDLEIGDIVEIIYKSTYNTTGPSPLTINNIN